MAAKKRDRRASRSSDRRDDGAEPSTSNGRIGARDSTNQRLITIFVIVFIVSTAISVLVYRLKSSSNTNRTDDSYVRRRRLVKADVNCHEILAENTKVSENMSRRQYSYPVLAYITPWNSKGYEAAKRFNSKFTHLSPVWYDLKSQRSNLVLEGRHNVDSEWLSQLWTAGNAKVLPRVVLEAFPKELLTKKKQTNRAIKLIVDECEEMGYDGIVLESWSRWAAYGILHDPNLRSLALHFVKQLGNALHLRNDKRPLEFVYVIGPPHSENPQEHDFGPEDLLYLRDSVDGFSLMMYDFSSPRNPGPNAPLKWISLTLKTLLSGARDGVTSRSHKIFLGINFYGNDFIISEGGGGGAITGNDYIALLEKHKPIFQWEQNSGEHFFFCTDDNHVRHAVFYPTLMSIFLRLEEARKWGCGISIWEIGQGLDYFFDLL